MEVAATLRPHVLALDDDPSIRDLLSDYLSQNGLRVAALENSTALAETLSREAIDLVVLDLRLPGEDGMQIMHRLRESSSIQILLLIGIADEADPASR